MKEYRARVPGYGTLVYRPGSAVALLLNKPHQRLFRGKEGDRHGRETDRYRSGKSMDPSFRAEVERRLPEGLRESVRTAAYVTPDVEETGYLWVDASRVNLFVVFREGVTITDEAYFRLVLQKLMPDPPRP